MKNINIKLSIVIVLFSLSSQATAQYTFFTPKGSFAIEVSLPNSDLKRLPIYRNSISSLAVVGDNIIGGTSASEGLTPYIFVASLKEQKVINVFDLDETIKNQQRIATGFIKKNGNILFAGTIANQSDDGSNNGGHLLTVIVSKNGEIEVKDLGTPITGEGIFALTGNVAGTKLFGITYPSGIFFSYNIKDGKTKTFHDIVPSEADLKSLGNFALGADDYLCKALIEADNGMIYGSAPLNRIFYFNPEQETFTFFDDYIPQVWGRRSMGAIESWAKSKDGKIYGGNAGDGQLFILDPSINKVKNLGKPIMMNRLRGLSFGADGKLYGIAGAAPGYAHLFSYDDTDGFIDYGNPEFEMIAPGIEQGILWRGFQLRTIASSEDGKYIIMGEDESLSQLMVFPTQQIK